MASLPTLRLDLDRPLVDGARSWEALELREPRVSEVRASLERMGSHRTPVAFLDQQVDLVARIAGIPAALLDDLPAATLDRAVVFVTSFEAEARRKEEDDLELEPTVSIELEQPIETERGTYTLVPLRQPTVRERRKSEAHLSRGLTALSVLASEIALVEAVSGLPTVAVLKMPISPFARAADYCTGFFVAGRATGGSSRPN